MCCSGKGCTRALQTLIHGKEWYIIYRHCYIPSLSGQVVTIQSQNDVYQSLAEGLNPVKMVAECFIPIEARSGHRLVSVLVMKIFTNKRHLHLQMVCGFVLLRLNVPVNNFSVMSGRSHRFLGITSTFSGSECGFAQGHNTAERRR